MTPEEWQEIRERPQSLLDGIRDEVREAVEEGDRQDCSSPDCIADAVYEIVRVRLRDLLADYDHLVEVARALSDHLYDGIGWIERGPTGMSIADAERLDQLGDALRALIDPATSEGRPTDA